MRKIFSYVLKNIWVIIFLVIFFVSTLIKGAEVMYGNFPFTMDQGRDMVDIRHMVVTLRPRLVGPTTSINGVLLGPFWYYFNLIPFIAGGGDPSFIVYWQILWYQISVITLWFIIKKKNLSLATIISLCLFLMPTGFNTARYFWNANSMPFFTVFYFAALIWAIHPSDKKTWRFLILGLVAGLAMQIEAAFGIILFPFAFLYFLLCRKIKNLIPLSLGFGLTLLPQILFELKHGFIMSKLFIGEITGRGEMLGEKITLAERATQRWDHFRSLLFQSSHLPPNYLPYLLVAGLIVFIYIFLKIRNKARSTEFEIWSLSFYFIIFTAIFYLLFPQSLKIWYTLGLSVPIVIFFGSFLNYLNENKRILLKAIGIVVICLMVYYSVKSQVDYTRDVASKQSDDRSNMRNEIAALDWIYENADDSGFNVYSYLPSVYDYPYNHLFWWYGASRYGYHPNETAYLPGQPEYIRDVDKLWSKKRPVDEKNLTFLIIEKDVEFPSRTLAWLGNFSKLCTVKEYTFPWHTIVKMMSPCKK